MKNIRKVDLHIHTCASDGEWKPTELLEKIKETDIKIFAINDHDTIDSVEEMTKLVKDEEGLIYIPSMELSVTYNNQEIHILCYNLDFKDKRILDLVEHNCNVRTSYHLRLLEALMTHYKGISVEDYNDYHYDPHRGGWKMLHYVLDRGIVEDMFDFFRISNEANVGRMVFKSPEEVLPILIEAGVTPVLAHPSYYTEGDIYDINKLAYWKNVGIGGIECYSQYLKDINNSQYYVDFCNENNLCITGGSDCHGGFAGRKLGIPNVTEDMIRLTGIIKS